MFVTEYLILILVALLGYLFGSISFSVLFGKLFYKKDVREYGSGNAGATNVLRTLGKKPAIAVAVCDMLKGIIAFLIAKKIGSYYNDGELFAYAAGFMAVIGHNFPVFFGFRGGKGILTSLGLSFMIDWRCALIALLVFIIVFICTKYVSLGSILGCTANAVAIWLMPGSSGIQIGYITLLAVLAIIKHWRNIIRLINGTENKISFNKKGE